MDARDLRARHGGGDAAREIESGPLKSPLSEFINRIGMDVLVMESSVPPLERHLPKVETQAR